MAKYYSARLETRLEPQVREKFSQMAKENYVTPSELNRALIIQFVKGDLKLSPLLTLAADSSIGKTSEAS